MYAYIHACKNAFISYIHTSIHTITSISITCMHK